MPLSDANVIQENSNVSTATTSHVVSLPSGTTVGNTLLIYTFSLQLLTPPAGFTGEPDSASLAIGIYRKEITASETSWTFTAGVSGDAAWSVKEMSNIDLVEPQDVTAVNGGSGTNVANGGTLSTGTTAQNGGLSVMVDVIYAVVKASGETVSWSGFTNGFGSISDVAGGAVVGLAVARKYQEGTTSTFSSTATLARSGATNTAQARVVAYRAADAPLAAPLAYFTGYEFGTHGGMGNNSPSNPQGTSFAPSGTWGTTYSIGSSFARNSGYGLRVAVSGTSSAVGTPILANSPTSVAVGFNVRVVSATGVANVATLGTSSNLQVVYDASTNKFGVRWGTNTVSYQSGTTALNTWVWIDVRAKIGTATWHADWRIETGTNTYTDQTSPTDLTGQTPSSFSTCTVGANTASTVTADYDDFVVSRYWAAYPLSPHTLGVLVPTTTGASVVGTSTNFSKFTANGTLAAWAADAGALLDEVPPTISASSDGVVQTAVAASDYMKFPMTDPTLASDEVFAAARAVIPTWGGTGTGTGTLWLAVFDGVTETVIDAGSTAYDGDSLTAASSTYPIWRTGVIPAPSGGWNPTRAGALEGRVGKSSDATPDMGVSAFYIEYAKRKAITARQATIDDPISATADVRVNPYNSASVSYLVTNNDATRSVNFNYTGTGTPSSPVTVAPSTNQEVTVTADNFGDIPDVSLEVI